MFDGKTENREKESKILCGPFIHSHSGCPLHMDPNSDSDPDADIAITTTFVLKTCVYVHTWIHTCVDMSKGLSCARKKQPKENRRRPWPFFVGKNIRFCVYVLPELSNITVCVCERCDRECVIVDLSGCDCNFMRIITPGHVETMLRKTQTT